MFDENLQDLVPFYNVAWLMKTLSTLLPTFSFRIKEYIELEQLERLRSEDTPRRLMITHTIGSQVKKIIDLELKTLQSRHDFQSQGQMTLKI